MLDKSSKKYLCPRCGKKKLVRFIDSKTGELQSSEFGRCDREDSCRYFLYPKGDWKEYGKVAHSLSIRRESELQKEKTQVFIPWEALKTTWEGYNECSFITYLISKGVPDSVLEKVIEMYYLGTINSGYLSGALSIPYINTEGNIVFVQLKMFDESNKTIKTSALHSYLKNTSGNEWVKEYERNEQKVTCFFGAHLLKKYPKNPVAIVEAPKTAIYATCYLGVPEGENDFIWLAVYNKSSLTEDKFEILKGRKIVVFPDLSVDGKTFNEWCEKAFRFANKLPNTTVVINDFLEQYAPDELRQTGGDFADYLCQFTWKEYKDGIKIIETGNIQPLEVHITWDVSKERTAQALQDFLEPQMGYSRKDIILMLSGFEYFSKWSDLDTINYLLENKYIMQDYERDNYYKFDSTPF